MTESAGPNEAVRIAVVVGNPKAQSRTLGVANAVAAALAEGLDVTTLPLVVDLAEHAGQLFEPAAEQVIDLVAQVARCQLLVVASPTFKASYTGLLKAFFDRYGYRPLEGSVAVPVMTGAASTHALAVEVHLRPLLVELGASVPTGGLYVTEGELPELDAVVAKWGSSSIPLIRRALR
jgi:FMN reductase